MEPQTKLRPRTPTTQRATAGRSSAVDIVEVPPSIELPPPPSAEQRLFISVEMPRVTVRLLQDYDFEQISFRVHSAAQPCPITDVLGGVYVAGTVLIIDAHAADELRDPPWIIGPLIEVREVLPEPVERRFPRLYRQTGERCTWQEYTTLRDQLIEQNAMTPHWRWVNGEAKE